MSSKTTTVRSDCDGRMFRQTDSGWEEVVPEPLPPVGPDFEPAYDPENPPLTEEELKRMKPMAEVKRLRWHLGLSREAFAKRYRIPVDTVRDWEHHRSEPDAPAKALLKLIAADPEGAADKLNEKQELSMP